MGLVTLPWIILVVCAMGGAWLVGAVAMVRSHARGEQCWLCRWDARREARRRA